VPSDQIHAQKVDVFAPCALGGGLNSATIPHIQAPLVCGLANNQLHEERHGAALHAARITWVPDYVANGGGITAAGALIYSSPTAAETAERIDQLFGTVTGILEQAEREGRPTSQIADEQAQARIANA